MKTREQLLAQLEAEQAAGDPAWNRRTDDLFRQLLALLDSATREDATVIHLHHRARRAA